MDKMWRIRFVSKQFLGYSFPSIGLPPHSNVTHKTIANRFLHSKKLSTLSKEDPILTPKTLVRRRDRVKNDPHEALNYLRKQQESLTRTTNPVWQKESLSSTTTPVFSQPEINQRKSDNNSCVQSPQVDGAHSKSNRRDRKNDPHEALNYLRKQQENLTRTTNPVWQKESLSSTTTPVCSQPEITQRKSDDNSCAQSPQVDGGHSKSNRRDRSRHSNQNLAAGESRIKLNADEQLSKLLEDQDALMSVSRELSKPQSSLVERATRIEASNSRTLIDREGYAVSSTLRAFAEACDVISEMPLALKSLRQIKATLSNINKSLRLDISVYHLMLRCVARQSNLQDFEFLWVSMEADWHAPDASCYASLIQCLGSNHRKKDFFLSNKFVKNKLEAFEKSNLTLSELAKKEGVFPMKKDLDQFIEGAKILDSKFEFVPRFQNKDYDPNCTLVSALSQRRTDRLSASLGDSMTRSEMDMCYREQFRREEQGYVDIKSIVSQGAPELEMYAEKLCNEWRVKLRKALELQISRQTKRAKFTQHPKNVPIYPFFKILDIDDYVDIMIQEVTKVLVFSESYSPTVSVLQLDLGNKVMKKFRIKQKTSSEGFREKMNSVFRGYYDWYFNPGSSQDTWCHREALNKFLCKNKNKGPSLYEGSIIDWPHGIRVAIGRDLFHLIINELRVSLCSKGGLIIGGQLINFNGTSCTASPVPPNQASCPALYKLYRLRTEQRHVEEVKAHPVLLKLFGPQKFQKIRFLTPELPMLVPSVPWLSPNHGGFLLETANFVRAGVDSSSSPLEASVLESRLSQAYPVFDCLNQLGSTPWIINNPILDLVIHVFCNQTDEYFSKDLLSNLSIPMNEQKLMKEEKNLLQLEAQESASKPEDAKTAYKKKVAHKQAFQQMQKECFSLWCNTLYGLSIANTFRNNVVFFPHNIDFRGRVYPLPPHFNHMGNDLSRSLLVFAKGKPLGRDGFNWLKIHCVNLTGKKKKESLDARLAFANENLDQILKSANHPFENVGSSWWIDSDEPWQTLAACIEIRNALNCPCPEEFVSHLPIHQDGSCNGLQHYAALGRDVLGGRSVNVLPAEKPQDVYSEIAAIVNQKRSDDESKGDPIAKVLNGFVDRKVVKQTVMTTVYGVTQYGAKLQIERQLKDNKRFPMEDVDKASKYLAAKTFESLNEMFTASQQIQAWFTDCAVVISGTFSRNVEWETPLGLAVIQPYSKRYSSGGNIKSGKPELSSVPVLKHELSHEVHVKPNTVKQRNGFPPNFVHSLDSTHMMLTSLYLWDLGITFASVHDCYWTHACSVTSMNVVCREQFIALHSQPILQNLARSFIQKYMTDLPASAPGVKAISRADLVKAKMLFEAIPKQGDLDLELVKKSIYFFS